MSGDGSPGHQAKIDDVIGAHLAELRRPGVLSVRPGFEIRDGWLTGRRAIVVTVAAMTSTPADGTLPDEIAGIPVDVRQASDRKRLSLQDSAAAAGLGALSPDTGALPEFPTERVLAADRDTPAVSLRALSLGAAAAKPQLPYTPPPNLPLDPVSAHMTIHLSASPDNGWAQLQQFLAATQTSLTVGIYDFTSAHILQTVQTAMAGRQVTMVLDHPARNPTADQTDEQTAAALRQTLGADFGQVWALDRMDPKATAWIYPTAYHIKVAVRDHTSVWLSSGNWNNSNQPDISPATNPSDAQTARIRDRDWHVVIDHPQLASLFEQYLLHDHDQAGAHNQPAPPPATLALAAPAPPAQTPPFIQFFPTHRVTDHIRVQPLLTPDPGVYVNAVKALIAGAKATLYLQYQYIELPGTPTVAAQPFIDLVGAVVARQNAGVDVKIITSEYQTAGYLEQLQTAGIDVVHNVKIQNNVHNKGIIVDGHTVLVSSQNWSTAGTLQNRDAGLIIHNARAAGYYQNIFLHDWNHLATQHTTSD
jgi:phosphatidylserine/phosphatidylglycerophosphate/cardiolipin synthase-like enzyme